MPVLEALPVAKKKTDKADARSRIDVRAEPEWVARVERQAKRLGLTASSWVRMVVSERLERDERSEPKQDD